MDLIVSTVAFALGAFVAASPAHAARIWGSERLDKATPVQRGSLLRWYRVLGVLLCLGGMLLAVDNVVSAKY